MTVSELLKHLEELVNRHAVGDAPVRFPNSLLEVESVTLHVTQDRNRPWSETKYVSLEDGGA